MMYYGGGWDGGGGGFWMLVGLLLLIALIVLVGWPSSVLLWYRAAHIPVSALMRTVMTACFVAAGAMSLATWWFGMRSGVRALDAMDA